MLLEHRGKCTLAAVAMFKSHIDHLVATRQTFQSQ